MNTRLFVLTTLAAALAACSTVPDRNAALDQARARYAAAQNNPQVTTLAPEELKRAGEALGMADKAQADGATLATVDHLAYMGNQRVTIAQDTASSRAAQAVTAGAAAERDRIRLATRTNEANAAQSQLIVAQESNVVKSIQLDAAAQMAMNDKARLDRRDAQVNNLEMQLRDMNAKKTERGMVVTLGDTLFATGQSQLQPEGARNMTKLAEFLKRNPERKASIEGYTDSVGGADANQTLSDRRAHAVMSALIDLGVPSDHLSTQAFGEANPVASNSTAAGRQSNRRVEIVFAPQAGDLLAK
jgi:outer membrane protein OmpA-like peptidoglycan-associated protein